MNTCPVIKHFLNANYTLHSVPHLTMFIKSTSIVLRLKLTKNAQNNNRNF